MLFIKTVLVFILFVIMFMMINSTIFDYAKREHILREVSSKTKYVAPSFTFKSKEYREFVYVR